MQLHQLQTRNFRNLAPLDLELPPEGIVVLGDNGHGKTNLLEAIYYLVLFRSFRRATDRELIRFGEPGFFVAGAGTVRIAAGYEVQSRRKKVTVDGTEVGRLADAVGHLTAVVLSPEDRTIVAGGPAARRRFLDILLSLAEPGYLGQLAAMRQALKQRNAALRNGRGDAARAFDEPLARAGAVVAAARRRWAAAHAEAFQQRCAALGEASDATLAYRPDHHRESDSPDTLRAGLAATADRDLRRGMTTTGPHRDDLALAIDQRDARAYGSAGQQRTVAIALRLLEAETLRAARGAPPLALYDDVFAELDARRQRNLLTLIRDVLPGQAIVAAPRESEVPPAMLDRPRHQMCGGHLE